MEHFLVFSPFVPFFEFSKNLRKKGRKTPKICFKFCFLMFTMSTLRNNFCNFSTKKYFQSRHHNVLDEKYEKIGEGQSDIKNSFHFLYHTAHKG